jgi:hypothetical protein
MRNILLVLATISVSAVPATAAVVRVPSEHATINQGIDAASAGDTVLVAPGLYSDFEVRMGASGPISSCAFLKEGVVLRSEAGPSATTIDRMGVDTPEPATMISVEALSGQNTLVEGFRVTGNPFGNTAVAARLFATNGEVTLRDCVFEDLEGGESTGGVRVIIASVRFEGCEFLRCSGAQGAIKSDDGNLTIIDCLFEECSTTGAGVGAVGAGNSENEVPIRSCTVRSTVFRGNRGWSAGALAVLNFRAGALIEDCVFENNVAENAAAGALIGGNGEHVVRGCLFVGNRAEGGGSFVVGGAIYATNVFRLENNTIVNSYQQNPQYGGSAIFAIPSGSPASVIRSNVIVNSSGAAAIGLFSGPLVTECNVLWNNAAGDAMGFSLDPTDQVVDPQLCDPKAAQYTVSSSSPCLPENNASCEDLIGAFGAGCGLVSIPPMSWGQIKGLYQTREE